MRVALYCDLPLVTNIAFPELRYSDRMRGKIYFSLESTRGPLAKPMWLHQWFSPSGEVLLSYCWQDPYHWLRFTGLADFRLSADGSIVCHAVPVIPLETIRHLFLDQVLPRFLAHQGRMMLHASAVRLNEGVLLFLGDSGTGKSTLAGNFHQAGAQVVSDDCLWVRQRGSQVWAVPSYGGLRLWDDSLDALFSNREEASLVAHYSTKKRLPLTELEGLRAGHGLPIQACILLSPQAETSVAEICLARLSHRESFIGILRQTFQLNLLDVKRMTSHMQALGRIVPRIKAYRLSMPRDYALLSTVRQRILDAIL